MYFMKVCVYFMSVNVTFAVAVRTRKVSRRTYSASAGVEICLANLAKGQNFL